MSAGRSKSTTAAVPRATPAPGPLYRPAQLTPNQQLGQTLAAKRGWTGHEWECALTLFHRESGWNQHAQNPTSTAYGIGQFLNGTWGDYGQKTADPQKQISYALAYVADRYRTPCRAWAAWSSRSPHWY